MLITYFTVVYIILFGVVSVRFRTVGVRKRTCILNY
jgi:hypothetical protein